MKKNIIQLSNGEYISLLDLKEIINNIEMCDCIITPYYLTNNKVYELYQ